MRFFFRSSVLDILKLSFPIILAQLGNVLLGLTDTIMLGQFGKKELAAVGIANQIFFLISIIGMGIMTALTPIIAASKGASNKKECGEFLRSGIELSFIISTALCIMILFISANFEILHQDPDINLIAARYLKILAPSVFPMLLFLALKHFNDGLSFSKPAMVITFIGVAFNFFLNWIFIFGNFSFPALGATGAAIATLIARILMALLLVLYIFKNASIKIYLPPLISTYNTKPVIKKLLKLGFPTGFQIFFEVGAYTGAAIITGWISLEALAAHQIIMGIIALCYMIATGISVAGSVKVAQSFGQGNIELIKKNGILAISTAGAFMLISSLILFLFHDPIISIFTDDPQISRIASQIFIIMIMFQVLNGLQVTGTGVLKGVEDIRSTALFTLLAYWFIGLPLCYFLAVRLNFALEGIWEGLLIALALSLSFVLIKFYTLVQSNKVRNYKSNL